VTDPLPAVVVDQPKPGIRWLTLNRPERLNAINDAFVTDLHAALDGVEGDPSCRVVLLTGAGKGFCAGFDMKAGDYNGDPAERGTAALMAGQRRLSGLALRLHELPVAVIAAVNGAAAGGGSPSRWPPISGWRRSRPCSSRPTSRSVCPAARWA
jgi:enoyl-CoA hydratase